MTLRLLFGKTMRMHAFLVLVLALATFAVAQPTIQTVEGEFIDGDTLFINGTSFGTAPQVISWDDFETGGNGNTLSDPEIGPTWSFQHPSSNTPYPSYSTMQAYSGGLSAKVAWREPGWSGYSINAFGWASEGPYNTMYLTYMRYHDPSENDAPSNMNHKQLYTFGPANSNNGSEQQQFMPFMIPAGQNSFATMLQATPADIFYWYDAPRYYNSNYSWGRWEFWLDYEDTAAQNDGHIITWYNLQEKRNETGINLCDVEGGQFVEDLRIGHMFQGFENLTHVRSFFDDVYIATTRARVELGNASTYAACTRREIQVAAEWGSTRIEVPLRTVQFTSGEQVYLYIIDEDGTISSGYAIELGEFGDPDPGPPGEPGQPSHS